MSDKLSYTEIYLRTCDLIKDAAEKKLEHPLTPQELAHIYNAGSLMMLESVERGIEVSTKANLSATLLSTSFLDRLDETKRDFPKRLEEDWLIQPLSQQLIDKLMQLPYVYSLFQILLTMEQTAPEARYQELTRILDETI